MSMQLSDFLVFTGAAIGAWVGNRTTSKQVRRAVHTELGPLNGRMDVLEMRTCDLETELSPSPARRPLKANG